MNTKELNLAWRAYVHLICATDLSLRLHRECNASPGTALSNVHTNSVGVLYELETILRFKFRRVISDSDNFAKVSDFFEEAFINSMAKDLAPFYFHGEHSNGAERYRFLFTDQIGTIWNSQARKLREDSLGTFNIRLHGARHDERYGFRETLKMALRLVL